MTQNGDKDITILLRTNQCQYSVSVTHSQSTVCLVSSDITGMMTYYTLPSLVSLALERLLSRGCPPSAELAPLPPHLKDPLRRVLLKVRGVT